MGKTIANIIESSKQLSNLINLKHVNKNSDKNTYPIIKENILNPLLLVTFSIISFTTHNYYY